VTVVDQRSRILDAAIGLMADHGAHGMSMRGLAAACDLNVATLYHYFPSKQDLFRAAIAHGRHDALLTNPFPEGVAGDPTTVLTALLDHVFSEISETNDLWRVLLTEYLHDDPDVAVPLLEMSAAFEEALVRWLSELLPDVPALHEPRIVRALRLAMYGVLVEHLPNPTEVRDAMFAERARDIAEAFVRLTAVPGPDSHQEVHG
jgi:AcrR family transcriptional regulator